MTTETPTQGQTKVRRPRPAAVILTASAEARVAKLMAAAPADAIGVKPVSYTHLTLPTIYSV